ncbi:hypothetical protein BH10CYA1_BH10CYA1_41280 [soil metagenome]
MQLHIREQTRPQREIVMKSGWIDLWIINSSPVKGSVFLLSISLIFAIFINGGPAWAQG